MGVTSEQITLMRRRDRDILEWSTEIREEEGGPVLNQLVERAEEHSRKHHWRVGNYKRAIVASLQRTHSNRPELLEPLGGFHSLLGSIASTTYFNDTPRKPICPDCRSPRELEIRWVVPFEGTADIVVYCEANDCSFTTRTYRRPLYKLVGTFDEREASKLQWIKNCEAIWDYVASLTARETA